MTNNRCPFESRLGYATLDGRNHYLQEHGISGSAAAKISTSLQADPSPSAPLYYWQLYSLLGDEPIFDIVKNFYERVYGDKEESWFRDAFRQISGIDHHVQTQALYWIDSMGGGKLYHGGNYRLNIHHSYNAAQVMTAAGATRWMYHMRGALLEQKFQDPRILPCIVDFLKIKMKVYAKEHGWEFAESDFEFCDTLSNSTITAVVEEKKVEEDGSIQQFVRDV